MPVRVQRFRLRMMRYQFIISHVPGKDLTIADTLSRIPSTVPISADQLLQEEANAFVSTVVQCLPANEQLLEIKQLHTEDEACQKITKYCQSGWPEHSGCGGKTLLLTNSSRTLSREWFAHAWVSDCYPSPLRDVGQNTHRTPGHYEV